MEGEWECIGRSVGLLPWVRDGEGYFRTRKPSEWCARAGDGDVAKLIAVEETAQLDQLKEFQLVSATQGRDRLSQRARTHWAAVRRG